MNLFLQDHALTSNIHLISGINQTLKSEKNHAKVTISRNFLCCNSIAEGYEQRFKSEFTKALMKI